MSTNLFLCPAHETNAYDFCLCDKSPVYLCSVCFPKHQGKRHDVFPIAYLELYRALGNDKAELKRRSQTVKKMNDFFERVTAHEAAVVEEAKGLIATLEQKYRSWVELNHRSFSSLLEMLKEEMNLLMTSPHAKLSRISELLMSRSRSLGTHEVSCFSDVPANNVLKQLIARCERRLSRVPMIQQRENDDKIYSLLIADGVEAAADVPEPLSQSASQSIREGQLPVFPAAPQGLQASAKAPPQALSIEQSPVNKSIIQVDSQGLRPNVPAPLNKLQLEQSAAKNSVFQAAPQGFGPIVKDLPQVLRLEQSPANKSVFKAVPQRLVLSAKTPKKFRLDQSPAKKSVVRAASQGLGSSAKATLKNPKLGQSPIINSVFQADLQGVGQSVKAPLQIHSLEQPPAGKSILQAASQELRPSAPAPLKKLKLDQSAAKNSVFQTALQGFGPIAKDLPQGLIEVQLPAEKSIFQGAPQGLGPSTKAPTQVLTEEQLPANKSIIQTDPQGLGSSAKALPQAISEEEPPIKKSAFQTALQGLGPSAKALPQALSPESSDNRTLQPIPQGALATPISPLRFISTTFKALETPIAVLENEVKLFDVHTAQWQQLLLSRKINVDSRTASTFMGEDQIFVCGGGPFISPCNLQVDDQAYILDIDGTLHQQDNMRAARGAPGIIHDPVVHVVYVFGGYGAFGEALRSCEKFTLPRWLPVPDMNTARAYFNPCMHMSVVFLCGGNTVSVETYVPQANTFTLISFFTLLEGESCTAVSEYGSLVVVSSKHIYKLDMEQRKVHTESHGMHLPWSNCTPVRYAGNLFIVKLGEKICCSISLVTGEKAKRVSFREKDNKHPRIILIHLY